jgi:hypothetical protein
MGFRPAVLPCVAIGLAACVLATATATVAFGASRPSAAPARAVLVVPDVRRQAYVFAKGTLEEAGFAWRVRGSVEGYAANTVADQDPAAGTRLLDTGAPTIALTLRRNLRYAQKGTPENVAPFAGTAVRSAALAAVRAPVRGTTKPRLATKPKHAAKPKPGRRAPAFHVAGAPREPLNEITLDARARALDAWLAKHSRASAANTRHWLYQHAWIVTGARFGWSHGEAALRLLVAVDRKVETRWGVGSRSRAVAEQAVAQVRERSR